VLTGSTFVFAMVEVTAGRAEESGAAVAAKELRSHDWRTATVVSPLLLAIKSSRQRGCRSRAVTASHQS